MYISLYIYIYIYICVCAPAHPAARCAKEAGRGHAWVRRSERAAKSPPRDECGRFCADGYAETPSQTGRRPPSGGDPRHPQARRRCRSLRDEDAPEGCLRNRGSSSLILDASAVTAKDESGLQASFRASPNRKGDILYVWYQVCTVICFRSVGHSLSDRVTCHRTHIIYYSTIIIIDISLYLCMCMYIYIYIYVHV